MKKSRFLGLVIIVLSACTHSIPVNQPPTRAVAAGTYAFCPFWCEIITLKKNGRFESILDGDLFNNQRAQGNWTIDREGHILLKGDQQPRIEEKISPLTEDIRFRVFDQNGPSTDWTAILTCQSGTVGFTVSGGQLYPNIIGDSKLHLAATAATPLRLESDGFVVVSNCQPVEFWAELYSSNRVRYTPTDPASNEFQFTLNTNTDFYVTDQKYLWKSGYLYAPIPAERGGGWSKEPHFSLRKSR